MSALGAAFQRVVIAMRLALLGVFSALSVRSYDHPMTIWKASNPYMGYTQNLTYRSFPLAGASIKLAQNSDEGTRKVRRCGRGCFENDALVTTTGRGGRVGRFLSPG